MATLFASKTDIQAYIRPDHIQVDDANSAKQNIEATRIVKGQLAGFFAPVVISSWADPSTTPDVIRGITGRLTAALLYASSFSEESGGEVSAYANWLYAGALAMINQILAGNLTVTDSDDNPIDSGGGGLLSFFPDDTTTPAFTMDQFFS